MTPEEELVVPEVPTQTDEGRRALRVAFLRQRFPNGVQAHQFADMLYALEIVEELFPAVLRAVAARPPPPTPIVRHPPASPPATPEPTPLSKGAQALMKLVEDTPKIPIEKLASELGYKQGYITQLVTEVRRSGVLIQHEIDPRTKSPRYYITKSPMRETKPSPPPSVQ